MLDKLSKDELKEAISLGVKEAILIMTESGDVYSGPIIRDLFLDAIKDGISRCMPISEDIVKALEVGTEIALQCDSYTAIEEGTRIALK